MKLTHSAGTLLLVLLALPLRAQEAPSIVTGGTPGECVQSANKWRTQQVTLLRSQAKPIDNAALLAESRRLASQCGAKFSLERTPSAGLVDLAGLYAFTGDTAGYRATVQRALAARDLTQAQHADALLLGVSAAIAEWDAFAGINPRGEALVRELDALPDSLIEKKVRGHLLLLSRYSYADIDDGIQAHAQTLVQLGRHAGMRNVMVNAFTELARAAADYLHPDSALRILDNAEREFGVPQGSVAQFSSARALYSLVGKPAAPISGEIWLNTDSAPPPITPGDGKIYLIQFTAHWCAPCRNSYPGMKRLADRFKGQNFEVIFVTELYGNFEGKRVTEQEELAADRDYYPNRHDIHFRIAVNRYGASADGRGLRPPAVNEQYGVQGIPQIVVVDGKGTIRQIVIGWDQGNERRLGSYIDSLLHGNAQ